MATVTKRLAKGSLSNTTNQTVYTVPTGITTIIKALNICNTSSLASTISIVIAGTFVVSQHTVKGNDTIVIPFLDQVMSAGETISMQSGGAVITYYISGKEVT